MQYNAIYEKFQIPNDNFQMKIVIGYLVNTPMQYIEDIQIFC